MWLNGWFSEKKLLHDKLAWFIGLLLAGKILPTQCKKIFLKI